VTRLVLLRHGQTSWHVGGRLAGWSDVGLSAEGCRQVRAAGAWLAASGPLPDRVYTSLLRRAEQTAALVTSGWPPPPVPPVPDWRLNERHFGVLQGLDRASIVARFGRRSRRDWLGAAGLAPPALPVDDPAHPGRQVRFAGVEPGRLPGSESRADLADRVMACWWERIVPDLAAGRSVLVVAHAGPIRVLIAAVEGRTVAETAGAAVPPAVPLAYALSAEDAADGDDVDVDGPEAGTPGTPGTAGTTDTTDTPGTADTTGTPGTADPTGTAADAVPAGRPDRSPAD